LAHKEFRDLQERQEYKDSKGLRDTRETSGRREVKGLLAQMAAMV
jgi:hypothetical protein